MFLLIVQFHVLEFFMSILLLLRTISGSEPHKNALIGTTAKISKPLVRESSYLQPKANLSKTCQRCMAMYFILTQSTDIFGLHWWLRR